ncbi:MAG: hypothetical protein HQM10_08165 [Candidatus Riflebacteria bacterium]|nr:hypothetical protein [Candidatus Riflebacteria bacterium]
MIFFLLLSYYLLYLLIFIRGQDIIRISTFFRIKIFHNFIGSRFAVIAALLTIFSMNLSAVSATPVNAGPYCFDITVRNSIMLIIPDAKVSCTIQNQTATIKALAPGYKSKSVNISLYGINSLSAHEIILEDVSASWIIQDFVGRKLHSVVVTTSQDGFKADEYGFHVHFPKLNWPRPQTQGIEVFDSTENLPIKQSCSISELDEYYDIRLSVPRAEIISESACFTIVIDTFENVQEKNINKWVNILIAAELMVDWRLAAVTALARFIYYAIPKEKLQAIQVLPKSLKALMDENVKFNTLHETY